MSTYQSTTVDRLRQAIADTLSIDAQGLQAAIGQLVVATSADYPAAGPEARSLHSSAVRTTVLLADRIPAGQEAQALAAEISRWHGRQAAQAVLGERTAELLGHGENVASDNEIRMFLSKAPRALAFDGHGIVDGTGERSRLIRMMDWGGIDQRINRRSGQEPGHSPFKTPVYNSIERHYRKMRKDAVLKSVVLASQFHSMRGHVAEGTRVKFESGEELIVRSAMRGWKLVSPDKSISLGPFDGAMELTAAVVQRDAETAGRVPLVAGDKVFVKTEQKLATVLDVYGDGLRGDHGDVRLDLCGNTSLDDIERYDSVKHAAFDHTFVPIKAEWKEGYGITQDAPLGDDSPSP